MALYSDDTDMYIIEKIIKLYKKLKKEDVQMQFPTDSDDSELEDVLTCKHLFLPIDSTNRIFACTKCGYLITKNRLKEKAKPKK